MKYILRKAVINPVPELEISEHNFNELKLARRVLSNACEIEQKYEIVISNFLDLEKELLHVTLNSTVRRINTYNEFSETFSVLNIRLVNLLTAVRLYLDHIPQHIKNCNLAQDKTNNPFKSRCAEEYDKHFEYRFMEELRNYVQHRGAPVQSVNPNTRRTSLDENGLMEFSVSISANKHLLEEDEKFKKKILNEMPQSVNLIAASRQYIESISAINEFVRELLAEPTKSARTKIELAHKQYSKICSESLVGLSAQHVKDSNVIASIPLLLDWDDVRIQLQMRNQKLVNLSKQYLTNKISL